MRNSFYFKSDCIDVLPEDLGKEFIYHYLPGILADVDCNDEKIFDQLWDKVFFFYSKKVQLDCYDWADIDYLASDIKNEVILMEYCDASNVLIDSCSMLKLVEEVNPDDPNQDTKYKNFMKYLKELFKLLYNTNRDKLGLIISGMQNTELRLFLTDIMKEKGRPFSIKCIEKDLYYNLVTQYLHIPELNNFFKIDSLIKLKKLFLNCISNSEKTYLKEKIIKKANDKAKNEIKGHEKIQIKIDNIKIENDTNKMKIMEPDKAKGLDEIEVKLKEIKIDPKEIEMSVDDLINNYRLERLLNVTAFCHTAKRIQELKSKSNTNILRQKEFVFLQKELEKGIDASLIDSYASNLAKSWTCNFTKRIARIPSVLCKSHLLKEASETERPYNNRHILYISNFAFPILSTLYSKAIECFHSIELENEADKVTKLQRQLRAYIVGHKKEYDCLCLIEKVKQIQAESFSKEETVNVIYSIYGNAGVNRPVAIEALEDINLIIEEWNEGILKFRMNNLSEDFSFPDNSVAAELKFQKKI